MYISLCACYGLFGRAVDEQMVALHMLYVSPVFISCWKLHREIVSKINILSLICSSKVSLPAVV